MANKCFTILIMALVLNYGAFGDCLFNESNPTDFSKCFVPGRVGIQSVSSTFPNIAGFVYIEAPETMSRTAYIYPNNNDMLCKTILSIGLNSKNSGRKIAICYTLQGAYRVINAIEELPDGK